MLLIWGDASTAPPPLEALEGVNNYNDFWLHFFEASPHAMEGFGPVCFGQIISIIGPSFLTFGHLNIPRVFEVCWNLICVVSRRKLGAQTGP